MGGRKAETEGAGGHLQGLPSFFLSLSSIFVVSSLWQNKIGPLLMAYFSDRRDFSGKQEFQRRLAPLGKTELLPGFLPK